MSKGFEFSIPIISSEELKIIDIKFNDIIDKVIDESIILKETLIEERLLKNLRNENKHLKKQNKFLMKQDNILQSLMQWLYKIKDEPVKLYMGGRQIGRTIEQARFQAFCEVIDKIKELEEIYEEDDEDE